MSDRQVVIAIDAMGGENSPYKVLKGTEKKLHVFHMLRNKEGELFATGEHLLLHVSLKTRKTCPASKPLIDKLIELQQQHQETSIPSEPKIIV